MTETTEQPPSQQTIRQGYEPPDVNNRALLIFAVIFVLFAIGANIGLWGLLKFYISEPRSVDVLPSAAPPPQRFPAPNLQPIQRHNQLPWQDLQDLQREKAEIFTQLGWKVDPDNGVPRIPDNIVSQLAEQRNSKVGGK